MTGRIREVQPPEARRKWGEAGVEAWLVHVEQTNAQKGENPLEWFLPSTAGALSKGWAKRTVRWHEARWGIEELFRGASYYSIPRFSSGAGAVLPQGAPVRRLAAQDPVQSEASQRPAVAVR